MGDYSQYEGVEGDQGYGDPGMQGMDPASKGQSNQILHDYVSKNETENGWKYSCTLCGKEALQKGNILKHVESVHFPNSFTYQCKHCEKTFNAKNSLYAHISRTHRN